MLTATHGQQWHTFSKAWFDAGVMNMITTFDPGVMNMIPTYNS